MLISTHEESTEALHLSMRPAKLSLQAIITLVLFMGNCWIATKLLFFVDLQCSHVDRQCVIKSKLNVFSSARSIHLDQETKAFVRVEDLMMGGQIMMLYIAREDQTEIVDFVSVGGDSKLALAEQLNTYFSERDSFDLFEYSEYDNVSFAIGAFIVAICLLPLGVMLFRLERIEIKGDKVERSLSIQRRKYLWLPEQIITLDLDGIRSIDREESALTLVMGYEHKIFNILIKLNDGSRTKITTLSLFTFNSSKEIISKLNSWRVS